MKRGQIKVGADAHPKTQAVPEGKHAVSLTPNSCTRHGNMTPPQPEGHRSKNGSTSRQIPQPATHMWQVTAEHSSSYERPGWGRQATWGERWTNEQQPQAQHTKVSVGIIMCRLHEETNRPEAILVQGRYTYAYAEFIHGHYSRYNTKAITTLFEHMTINERLDIFSLDFRHMWFRIWLTADRHELYNKKLSKFQAAWQRDGGTQLRRLVCAAQGTGSVRWEFPKGRRQSNDETDINCALREFTEETNIPKNCFQLLPAFKRRASYVHMRVRYVSIYYIAIQRRKFVDPSSTISLRCSTQVAEIADVRWMDIEQIRHVEGPGRQFLEDTASAAFSYIKRYARNRVNPRSLPFREANALAQAKKFGLILPSKIRQSADPRRAFETCCRDRRTGLQCKRTAPPCSVSAGHVQELFDAVV